MVYLYATLGFLSGNLYVNGKVMVKNAYLKLNFRSHGKAVFK